ncbi:MAG: pyruvate dehydrogenase (acetyl-transferring), homodimeric type [Candidatus Thalassarchaeaceae archaeon]|jgi:pyruvate dehydrogenase E1 component|nr:pyruvate dehydrogenase (acetyl-transferring), homodimeric type [Candidatus Thalassarchaeaceae archaeon]
MPDDVYRSALPDPDEEETEEWRESILSVEENLGTARARHLLQETVAAANSVGVPVGELTHTAYVNTIHPDDQNPYPGNLQMEAKILDVIRWNAMMMVTRGNKYFDGIGGHISTYASTAHLWEVGLNHFFKGKDGEGNGDHVYWQGHASPGLYARAWMEGRMDETRIENFRQEAFNKGLSSYPHPRLMPDYWEYPCVSMGLGAMTAIRQARFNRYLHNRDLADTSQSTSWYFMGDGESDEPESLSELTLASREKLDNIVMVINCNLQRLDGPVRGNSKIVQELAARFTGAGWNVIKCLWGSSWDELFSRDAEGLLAARLEALADGDEQRIMTGDGAMIRSDLFNTPELAAMVSHLSDSDLEALTNDVGGHDPVKIFSAYSAARGHQGRPTVVLARTIKGWGLGPSFAGRNSTHGKKKADQKVLQFMRDDMGLTFGDDELEKLPYLQPENFPDAVNYLLHQRQQLGGFLPERRNQKMGLSTPKNEAYAEFDDGTKGNLKVSTTMVFVKLMRSLMKADGFGKHVVPIVPDEARTFGMDPLFSEFGIYAPDGQLYKPVDHSVLMKYKESKSGQILEEGINEAGAMSTFIASGTSYSTQVCATIPFYIYYSMFGFQRVADLIWSAADSRTRGFLIGATAGRTTLNGEGLQHQDGHSHLMAMTNPAVRAWDPAYAYELATIIKHGIDEMCNDEKDVIHYITVYNENHPMPAKPTGVDEGIIRGLYRISGNDDAKVRLLGSGPIMLQVERAAEILEELNISCEIWSVTSYGELRRDAANIERWNRLHPSEDTRSSWVTEHLNDHVGTTVAVSDNMMAVPDLIRQWVSGDYVVLGTDGFGRSDTREALRRFFEIDAEHIVLASLSSLVRRGEIESDVYADAVKNLDVSFERDDITSI